MVRAESEPVAVFRDRYSFVGIARRFATVERSPISSSGPLNMEQHAVSVVDQLSKDPNTPVLYGILGLGGSTKTTTSREAAFYFDQMSQMIAAKLKTEGGNLTPKMYLESWDGTEDRMLDLLKTAKKRESFDEMPHLFKQLVNEINRSRLEGIRQNWLTRDLQEATTKELKEMKVELHKPFPELALLSTEILLGLRVAEILKKKDPLTVIVLDMNAGTEYNIGKWPDSTTIWRTRKYGLNIFKDLVLRQGAFADISDPVYIATAFLTASSNIYNRISAREVLLMTKGKKKTLQALSAANLAARLMGVEQFINQDEIEDYPSSGSLEQVLVVRRKAIDLVKAILKNKNDPIWEQIPDYLRPILEMGLDGELPSRELYDIKTCERLIRKVETHNPKIAKHMRETYQVIPTVVQPPLVAVIESLYVLMASLLYEGVAAQYSNNHFNGYVEIPRKVAA